MIEQDLPENWIVISLGEILSLKNGYAFKSKDYQNEGIPVIRISDIRKDGEVSSAKSVRVDNQEIPKKFLLKKGDVLVAMSGATTGKYGIFNEDIPALQNQRVGNLKPHAPNLTSKKFIFYLLGGLRKEIEDKAYGGAQPNISSKLIEEIECGLPPLPEQKRIVAKLDQLFGHLEVLKAKLDRIPDLLADFRQSVLTQAVTGKLTETWREGKGLQEFNVFELCENIHWNPKALMKYKVALEEIEFSGFEQIPTNWIKTVPGIICKKIVDGTHKTPIYLDEGVPFLSAKNIKEWKIDFKGCKYISREEHDKLTQRCRPERGSLLVTKSGTIGRMSMINFDPDFSLFESVAVLTPSHTSISAMFIGFSINVYLKSGGNEKHVKGTAVQHLHLNEIRTLPIFLPPGEEQNEIVRRVKSLFTQADAIEDQFQKLKEKLEHLPQAILVKAFRGELVAQLPEDGDARDLLAEIKKAREELKPKKKKKS